MMDITDISKVANRKRINVEAEKLREKVSRETAKIIKLKVAQDTAYWDLQEKLHQVENNHERLQQNMVEVQMQHESLSGQYQEELRLRPETLNKLSSTREICDVLEDYCESLKGTLSRYKTDQAALCEAYQRSGQVVREIRSKQAQAEEKSQRTLEALEEKLKLTAEHQHQLVQFFKVSKQQTDAALTETKARLSTVITQKEELTATVVELNRKLDQCKIDMNKKEVMVTQLQSDMKHLIHEFSSQANEMKNNASKLEKDIKQATDENGTLKKALVNQEEFTKTMCKENSTLQEKVSAVEEENIKLVVTVRELESKLEGAGAQHENLGNSIAVLRTEKGQLEMLIEEKAQHLVNAEAEIESLKSRVSALETEKLELTQNLDKINESMKGKEYTIEKLTAEALELNNKFQSIESDFDNYKSDKEKEHIDLRKEIATKDQELDSKAVTISQLISDVRSGNDVAAKLESALQRLRADMETERAAAIERERSMTKQVESLDKVVKNKEDELSKQMKIILDLRNEKDRLQEKIEGMQSKIDNIQKELTGPRDPPVPRIQPELDDNAVMFTPTNKKADFPPPSKVQKMSAPPPPEPIDSLMFSMFSDSSVEGDALDSKDVNRRFEALSRGDRLSPMPWSNLKRRSGVATGGLQFKSKAKEASISLSQARQDFKEKTFFKNKRQSEAKSKKISK